MGPELLAGPVVMTVLICGVTAVLTVGGFAVTGGIIYFVMKSMGQNKAVLQSGTPAQATVVQIWETGTYMNNQPQVGFLLEVRPPGGAPYQAQAKAIIPMVNIPQFQPGALVNVKISPTDPSKIALDIYA